MHSVESSIIIDVPVDACYEAWVNFESFPQFMSHVLHVSRQGDNEHGHDVWYWEIKGPLGRTFTWDATVVLQTPDKVITWTTSSDEEVANSGTVNFLEVTERQTLLEIKLTYSAPGAPFGELVADAFHLGDGLIDQALKEFKAHVERLHLGRVIEAEPIIAPSGKHMLSENEPMRSEEEVKRKTEAVSRIIEETPPAHHRNDPLVDSDN